jgi:lysyl-tRNA synthetase class II
MEHETNPLVQRRLKLEELKRRGYDPYPHKFDYSHTLGEIHAKYDAATFQELEESKPVVRVCGRIMALRPHGKAGFLDVFDGGEASPRDLRWDIPPVARAFHP